MDISLQPRDLENLLGNLWDATYFVDSKRRIIYWSKTAERISGYTAEEVMNEVCGQDLLSHHCDEKVLCDIACPMKLTLRDGDVREAQVSLRHKDGSSIPIFLRIMPYHDSEGKIIGAIEVFRRVPGTDEMTKMLQRMGNLANVEPLTQAARRHYGEDILEKGLSAFATAAKPLGILLIDIDDFKVINDRYGHIVGDKVLSHIANEIRSHLRASDLLVRWGGDEFLVITSGNSISSLSLVGNKICELMTKSPVIHQNESIELSLSIGGTMAIHGDTLTSIVDRADAYLYQSKEKGKNCCTIYDAAS